MITTPQEQVSLAGTDLPPLARTSPRLALFVASVLGLYLEMLAIRSLLQSLCQRDANLAGTVSATPSGTRGYSRSLKVRRP